MDYNRNLSESLAVVGKIDPSSQAAGELLSGAINMLTHRRIFAIISVGAFGASATVDATFKASSTSGGTYAAVTGTAITQALAGGGNNIVLEIELKAETLAQLGVGPFVKLSVTVGTAATLTSAVVLGACGRFEPESDNDLTAVKQKIVA